MDAHLYSPGTNLEQSELAQLETGTRTLDVAMYSFTDQELAEDLATLARRGVQVRFAGAGSSSRRSCGRAILRHYPQARIVMLTLYSGDTQAARALKLGVVGYILKGSLRAELVDTIRQVHSGQRVIFSQIVQNVAADDSSNRELDVLHCVANGQSNKVVSGLRGISEDAVEGRMRSAWRSSS